MIVSFGQHEVHLKDYFYILRKRRRTITLFFILSLLAGGTFTFFEKILYESTATIMIEKENPNVVDFKEVMALDASSTDYYQTQYLMLESESLIRKLIEKEHLMEDPYFAQLHKGRVRQFLRESPYVPTWVNQFVAEASPEGLFIRKMLRVDPVRNSRLVEIHVRHPDPARAAQLTNVLIDLFIQRNLEDRFSLAKRATELISKQLEELKGRVEIAERKLQLYKEKYQLVNIPSLTEKDEFLQEAKLELVKTQAEEAKLKERYLPAHPKLIHIQSQVKALAEKIAEEERKQLDLGRTVVNYRQLEREAESSRHIYQALLSRMEETTSEAKTQASNIIVVDHAQPPPRPFKPRPFLNMAIALFLGLVGGVLLAFFMEYLDSTIKIPDDVEKGLGLELFGIVPFSPRQKKGPLKGELFFDPSQPSPAGESIRALRTALLFRLRHKIGSRVILVTSANPEEGKSTISLNLAAAFHQNNLKVLLIDSDLRKPKLHKVLGLASEKGLKEVLEGEASFQDCVHENAPEIGVDFLSCGARSDHPTEILGSDAMEKFLTNLKEQYDIIIIDSPPFLAVADVSVLSDYADAITVITRYHKTDKRHLKQIRGRLNMQGERLLGVVINQVSVREKDYYYQQYYYYGYGDAAKKK